MKHPELFPSSIQINGTLFRVCELLGEAPSLDICLHEVDNLLFFLKEWYNPNSYIEVQTSGSTGKPKRIRLEKSFVANSAMRTIAYFKLKPGSKILHCLPLNFIAGKLMVVRALLGKLDMHIVPPTSNFLFLANESFSFAAMVVNQVEKLFALGNNWNIEHLLVGGSAIPLQLESKLSNVSSFCYSSYAMTETATHIAIRKINNQDNAYYQCLHGVEVSLDKDSCLCIRMDGLPDGYLQTKDIVKLKDEKTFQIIGRLDNCIISGGMKFYPEELEQKLQSFINVPFCIVAKAHATLGQQITLLVEAEDDESLACTIEAVCRVKLNKYEQPKEIIFVRKLSRTENGKIKRT